MKYKAVIFDLFGTLVDNYDVVGYSSALRETSSILKLHHEDFMRLWKETDIKRATGGFKTLEENLEYVCRELNTPVKKFDINLARMVRLDFVALALAPSKYAIETLSQLKEDGYKIGLISNCSMEPPMLWPNTPFAPFFDALLFSSTTGFFKPDPRIFQMAVDKLGVKPEECLFVDDNSVNLITAAALGMGTVLICDKEGKEQDHVFEKHDVQWHGARIKSIEETLDILVD
jgi:putative hydrolase of the HAD superfamily